MMSALGAQGKGKQFCLDKLERTSWRKGRWVQIPTIVEELA